MYDYASYVVCIFSSILQFYLFLVFLIIIIIIATAFSLRKGINPWTGN